jgi:two-component system phosphate regulon sensor histidine kinase PhoR
LDAVGKVSYPNAARGLENRWWGIPDETARSAVAIPLMGRGGVLAVLALTHDQPAHFIQEHLSLLQAISSQAAIAIENAQLFAAERKRVDELVAVNQLTREISKFNRCEELFEHLPQIICQMLRVPSTALWLVEGSSILALKSLAGAENAVRLGLLEIGPQQALAARKPIQLSGPISKSENGNGNGEGVTIQSVIAVPILRSGSEQGDQVVGVLSIHSRRAGAFQESDRVLLEMLAAHIANALERMQLFEQIERGQKRLSAVINGAADAILVMDHVGRLELANPAGLRLFTDVETRVGHQLPEHRGYDALIRLLGEAQQLGAPVNGEVLWPDERTFATLVSPLEEGGQVALLHDVSHFKTLDQLKNEFVATASHDLKNPIATILGYSSLLGKAGPLNEMQVDFSQRICNAAVQMQDLVLNLLDMARMDMGIKMDFEAIDLHLLIRQVNEEFINQVTEKKHTLILEFISDPAIVWGDKIRLQQVARNLIGNAIKYTPEGGRITVSTQIANGAVQTRVQDNGIGIPAEALPHLFSKFFRVRSEETQDIEGNGLGLAIVKSIIEKHNGQIQVESTPGKGSCFGFTLSCSAPC